MKHNKRPRTLFAVVIPEALYRAIEAHAKALDIPNRALVEAELLHLLEGPPRATTFRIVPLGGARPAPDGTCADMTGQGRRCKRPVSTDRDICELHAALRERKAERERKAKLKAASETRDPTAPPIAPVRPSPIEIRRPPPVPLSIAEGQPALVEPEISPPRPAREIVEERPVGGVVLW